MEPIIPPQIPAGPQEPQGRELPHERGARIHQEWFFLPEDERTAMVRGMSEEDCELLWDEIQQRKAAKRA